MGPLAGIKVVEIGALGPGGLLQPAPAPRFSSTALTIQSPPPLCGEHTGEILEILNTYVDELFLHLQYLP